MTWWQVAVGIAAGFGAGVLSGAFGVGGGIVTTPVVHLLLGGTAIEAVATPLPVIFPTALTGSLSYKKAGEISMRAFAWAIVPGGFGAIAGAALTQVINPHLLLVITAALLALQGYRLARGGDLKERPRGTTPGWEYALAGGAAGFVSGVLGLGGGIIFVPILTVILGMPLKRAIGTSLAVIAVIAVPGTIVHAWLGNINWPAFLVLVIGVVPGARLGAKLALRARERSLRIAVGTFMLIVAFGYGGLELWHLMKGAA